MAQLTEGKHLGGRRTWGKGTQSIALARHAIRGQNPPNFTLPQDDRTYLQMREAYNTQLQGILTKFRGGEITRGQFESQAKDAIRETFQKAYHLGTVRMGGYAEHTLDPQDLSWLKGARYQEFEYLNRFADALQNETYHVDPVQRMEMYADTLESMFWAGQISATADNAVINWNLGVSEHCEDCIALAAGGPYTRKTLPAVPRAGSTRCLVGCKCHLSVSYEQPPAIDDLKTKPWKPMREFDAAPPTGTRPPTSEEKGFIDNLGLRIRFETDLAKSDGAQRGNRHASIAAGIAAALATFLAARKIWAPPTWAADDTAMVTGEEFESAFEQDQITLAELEAMSDEEFDQFLEDYKERFPSDVPRKVKCIVDRAVAQSGRVQDDKARNAMRLLLEFNAFHDRIGRFAHAPATDGGGAYGGTVTVRQGSGKFMGQAFAHGHEDDIEIPEGKQVSVLYNPTNGHMGWMDGIGSHEIFLRAMNVRDAEESEQYVHVNILGYDNGPYRKSLGINVTSAAATVGTHATEAGAVNRTFAMLRTKGFPMETPVQWRQWNGINRDVKLGDTVQVDVEDPTALARRRLMPRGLLTSEELARSVAAEIVRQIRPE
jgi:hypothetical protein